MNRFRVNLHPAFFDVIEDKPSYENEESYDSPAEAEKVVMAGTRGNLDNHESEIVALALGNPEISDFSKIDEDVLKLIKSRRSQDSNYYKKHKEKWDSRLGASYQGGKTYRDMWNQNIVDGFNHLIRALEEKDYFKNDRDKAMAEVIGKYKTEVIEQYTRNVWYAKDKHFDEVKNELFSPKSANYPANEIYCRLTKASTIFGFKKSEGEVTTYDVTPTHEVSNEPETETTKRRINFLTKDLPNYLWEVKNKSFFQKYLPFVTSVDAPSFEDKKELKNFIKLVDNKLIYSGRGKPELELLKIFSDLDSNATEEDLRNALKDHNLSLKEEKYFKNVKRAFDFYNLTQIPEVSLRNQHALYLSILQVIKRQGGFDAAINAFERDVKAYQDRIHVEGRDYRKGKELATIDSELKAFAENLGISNYASATRLAKRKAEYFQNKDIVDILADFNNDGTINFADKGLAKTGAQFREIYKMVGEDVAIDNLLKMAKLMNATITNGAIREEEFTKEQINAGNKKLILLLQNIISNPGQDLRTLMIYGPDAAKRNAEIYSKLQEGPTGPEDPRVQSVVQEKFKNIDLSDIDEMEGHQVASSEGLHQAVAGALYTEYMRGVGLGGQLSFDEWAKGVSLSGGFQKSRKGISIGLNLAYNPEINLGKGWSVTPGASIGFIPLFKPRWSGSAGVEVAKKWIAKHSEHKAGLRLSFTEVFGVAHIYSAFLGYERDKAAGIEKDIPKMKKEFRDKVITPLLNSIAGNFSEEKPFDLTNLENCAFIEKAIDGLIDSLLTEDQLKDLTDNDKKRLKDNTIRYLLNHNNAPIYNDKVRGQIAEEMAETYSHTRAEQALNDIDGKTYLAGGGIGLAFVQVGTGGALLPSIGLTFKTESGDMYGDGALTIQAIDAHDIYVWNEEEIEYFNKYFSVSKDAKLRFEDGFIVIPQKALSECDIRINPGMKGLIKKDDNGNILLSPETYMDLPNNFFGAARKSTQVLIGGGDASKAVKLQDVLNDSDWFAGEGTEIDTTKLTGRENPFTEQGLISALDALKEQVVEDDPLKNFNFDPSILQGLEQGKRYIITLKKDSTGKVVAEAPREASDGAPLQLEYSATQEIGEMMKTTAQTIADKAYAEALKVRSSRLYLISHEAPLANGKRTEKWGDYVDFANAVKNKKYSDARNIIVRMLPKMDSYINKSQGNDKVNFSAMIGDLNNITDDVELGQAMLSINNIFARVSSVQGGIDGKYHFKKYERGNILDRSIGEIIGLRAGEIKRKINGSSLDDKVKNGYNGLIDFAETYRKAHPTEYKDTSRKGTTLHNAVGINLGNSISIENPLFNPEVYEGSIIEGEALDNFPGKEELRLHALEVMARDKSLMGPVLSALNIDTNSEPIKITRTNDGRISIDFGEKNVILNAEMKFGYFAQCVNHMILLDNISAEIPGEGVSVNYGPYAMGGGEYGETRVKTQVRKAQWGGNLVGNLGNSGGESYSKPSRGGAGNEDTNPYMIN